MKNNVAELLEKNNLDWTGKEILLLNRALNNFKELLQCFVEEGSVAKIELISSAFNDIKDICNYVNIQENDEIKPL